MPPDRSFFLSYFAQYQYRNEQEFHDRIFLIFLKYFLLLQKKAGADIFAQRFLLFFQIAHLREYRMW